MTDQLVAVAQHLLNNKRIQRWWVIAKWSAEESTYRRAECRICGALGEDMAIATTVCNRGGWPSDSQKARFYGDIAIHANLHRKQYSDGMSGPSKPAAAEDTPPLSTEPRREAVSSGERGQPRAGGVQAYVDENEVVQPAEPRAGGLSPEAQADIAVAAASAPPAAELSPYQDGASDAKGLYYQVKVEPPVACPHENVEIRHTTGGARVEGFYCKDCGERVG